MPDGDDVDLAVVEAKVADYDGLVLPGGVANPDALRLDADAVQFVRDFFAAGTPAFNAKITEEFAEGTHEVQAASV